MSVWGTILGSICILVILSDIETILTKFGQNPGFSLRNSVSMSLGPAVNFMILHFSPFYQIKRRRGRRSVKDYNKYACSMWILSQNISINFKNIYSNF